MKRSLRSALLPFIFILTFVAIGTQRASAQSPFSVTSIIATSAGPHGTINGIYSYREITVDDGKDFTLTFTPDPGYQIASITLDGGSVAIHQSLTLEDVQVNHIVQVTFEPATYTITADVNDVNGLGSISGDGTTEVPGAQDYSVTITPVPGFSISDIIVDGMSTGSTGSTAQQYTFPYVTADHTITATFVRNFYNITANAAANGSTDVQPVSNVPGAADFTIYMYPDPGYSVYYIVVDGVVTYTSGQSYTFPAVTADHTFEVFFTPNIYTLTTSAGAHGSVNPVGTTNVNGGSDVNIVFTPDPGYQVSGIVVDGVSSPTSTQLFVIPAVSANHTVSVTFGPIIFTITASAGPNGTIGPNGTTSVNGASDQTYTMTPAAGYKVSQVTVDGVAQGPLTQFTFSAIVANHSISATFVPNVFFTIKATAGANGTITPAGSASVGYGNNTVYSITPAAGYHVATLKIDGTSTTPVTNYTFTNVAANHTIAATFALTSFTLTASGGAGGTISPTGTATVSPGGTKTYTIKPSPGYTILDVTLDGASIGTVKSYVFTNVSANHLLIATFTPVTYVITSSAGANGTISPSGSTPVAYGGSQAYTFAPNAGYSITKLTVDNRSVTIAPSYAFTNVTAGHTIAVTYSCPKPNAPVLAGPATVTKQQSNLTYTVTNPAGATSFTWTVPGAASITSGQGTPSITVQWGKTAGSVTCIANSVCSSSAKTGYAVALSTATASLELTQETISVEPETDSNTLQVYPNPVPDRARVVFTLKAAARCKIMLIDLTGRPLTSQEMDGVQGKNETSFDVSRFANGVYFISLVHGKEIKTIKLIKAH
jgi:hypothetical protein